MMWLAVISVLLTATLMLSKSLWNRLLALTSLSVKVSTLIMLLAWSTRLTYIVDLGVFYALIGGAGMVVIISFLLGRDVE